MQIAIAIFALVVASGCLVWTIWRALVPRHPRTMAAPPRARDRVELSETQVRRTLGYAPRQPDGQVIHMKAARVRADRPVAFNAPVEPTPLRSGWNEDDDVELLRLVAAEVPTAEIAVRLGRSENSVRLRIPLLNLRHRQTGQMSGQRRAAGR